MKALWHQDRKQGFALILAMIFVTVFAALSVGFLNFSSSNTQIADNHKKSNNALGAAMSGLDCGLYLAKRAAANNPISTGTNNVTVAEADLMWNKLCSEFQTVKFGNIVVANASSFTDCGGAGKCVFSSDDIPLNAAGDAFGLRFLRYDDEPLEIWIEATGKSSGIVRKIKMKLDIAKDASVMNYALAGRGRMWITGDTTIHGSIYSSWNNSSLSPFNMTSDSSVEGTINTVLSKNTVINQSWQLETLDDNGNPMFDEDGNRIYSADDEIQGYHEGINYGQPDQTNIPGMRIGDYNTSAYKSAIPTTTRSGTASVIANGVLGKTGVSTVTEYFPHAPSNYSQSVSGSQSLSRYKYENKTLRNVVVPGGTQAVFKNCTFEEVLYVDCSTSGPGSTSSTYNNIRFENCTFNGTIITNVPQNLNSNWWKKNCLYFTGTATFQNNTTVPATILAPHFNVNLGNTNPNSGDNNVLTGAIVGGIVDIRGNAQIYGTIISMADTSAYASGYVTNIGATEEDGGSETTEAGDIGTIEITPDPSKMLPSGITTPIIIRPSAGSYQECI